MGPPGGRRNLEDVVCFKACPNIYSKISSANCSHRSAENVVTMRITAIDAMYRVTAGA
jgi:hypothetical protein